ncbi:THO complex subunit 1 transcription elongation factor-domain-containing protein, partial [Scenedesmus sp. NREL 46B-D3]
MDLGTLVQLQEPHTQQAPFSRHSGRSIVQSTVAEVWPIVAAPAMRAGWVKQRAAHDSGGVQQLAQAAATAALQHCLIVLDSYTNPRDATRSTRNADAARPGTVGRTPVEGVLRAALTSSKPVQEEGMQLLRQLLPQVMASMEQLRHHLPNAAQLSARSRLQAVRVQAAPALPASVQLASCALARAFWRAARQLPAASSRNRALVAPQQQQQQSIRPPDHAVKAALHCVFRQACLDLAAEAQQKDQAPLQYVPAKGSEPALQRLLEVALLACQWGLLDAALLFSLLEDLSEVCTAQHCLGMIGWLEQHRPLLNSEQFTAGNLAVNAFTRLCNGILRRLGKHQVVSSARLMVLIASTASLVDRSGLNINGVFVAPDAPKPEEVPEGAVDSTGNPVNVLLYQQFWELQGLLQDPLSLLTSADKWSVFKKQLAAVLEELAKAPATVPAARTAAAPSAAGDAAGSGTAAAQSGL